MNRQVRGIPPARALVAAGLGLEAAVLAAYALGLAVVAARGEAADRAGSLVLAATTLLLAAGVAAVCVGVARGQRWARSPAVLWQLLQLAVAVPAVGALPWLGVPAVLLAVAVGGGVLLDAVVPHDA